MLPERKNTQRVISRKNKLSKECLSMRKNRDLLKAEAKRTGDPNDWNEWWKAKNKVYNRIRDEKRIEENRNILKVEEDMTGKRIWEYEKRRLAG